MNTGRVRWFNELKGYGFIAPDNGGSDIFVHHSDILDESKTLNEGQKVIFETGKNNKGLCATNVVPA